MRILFSNETSLNSGSKHKKNTPQRTRNPKSPKQPTKICHEAWYKIQRRESPQGAWGKTWCGDTWQPAAGTFRSQIFDIQTGRRMHSQEGADISSTSDPPPPHTHLVTCCLTVENWIISSWPCFPDIFFLQTWIDPEMPIISRGGTRPWPLSRLL